MLYCLAGLGLELLQPRLAPATYGRVAAFFYGLPGLVLQRSGLEVALTHAVLRGAMPSWVAAAAFPATGVALILAASLLIGLAARFAQLVLSLKQE